MCIIIAKKAGDPYNEEALIKAIKTGVIRNDDGGGFAIKYPNGKKNRRILISKGYFENAGNKYDERGDNLIHAIKNREITDECELIVHLRYSTFGKDSVYNCHPYVVSNIHDNVILDNHWINMPAVAHNGTFYDFAHKKSKFSDTYHFTKRFLGDPENMKDLLSFENNQDSYIYKNFMEFNKLAIMFPDREMALFGDFIHEEDDNLYYSNEYYKQAYMSYSHSHPYVH